jgi:hypothetical protein
MEQRAWGMDGGKRRGRERGKERIGEAERG